MENGESVWQWEVKLPGDHVILKNSLENRKLQGGRGNFFLITT